MITLPTGLVILGTILYLALGRASDTNLFNPEAILLVGFGCLGVLILSAPLSQLIGLFRALVAALKPEPTNNRIDETLLSLAKNKLGESKGVHPLISYAQELWHTGIDAELFPILLAHRLEEIKRSNEGPVVTLRNLSKFPPAMGMTGTVIGLVSLFSHLTADNKGNLGPSLGLAMTATLYGLVVANMVLLPMADRLSVMHLRTCEMADRIYGVLLLIHGGELQDVIEVAFHGKAA